jgi:hypothetical protein
MKKPKCKMVGEDGNVFNLIGLASKALYKANKGKEAEEMKKKVFKAGSYDEALAIMMEYVDVY